MPPTTGSRAGSGGDLGNLSVSVAAACAASVESGLAQAELTAKLATEAVQELRRMIPKRF